MKITRRQLRRLIAEAYETRPPFMPAHNQSDMYIAKQYPQFTDKLASVDPRQREAFKQGLDSNRPDGEVIVPSGIYSPESGLLQSQINDVVDEFFSYNPKAYDGAMISMGMSLEEIAEEVFEHCLTGPGIGLETLVDQNFGKFKNKDDVKTVIRRYKIALSRPHHRQLGHIS
jgi:hypothetical protein